MKIALVNYRYFFSGGPERYMFNIKEILEKNGHEVIPFSIKHKKNENSEYEKYFLDPVGSGDEVYASQYKKTPKNILKVMSRMLYSFEAKNKFKTFLKDVKPDIIYILFFQNKISCSIIDAAYSMKIPVIQRISDYSLITPCNFLYQSNNNQICELCINKSSWNAVKYKCIYNSRVYSLIKKISIDIQELVKIKKKISKLISPSYFTLEKYAEAGYPQNKLVHIPTLFNNNLINKNLSIKYQNFALYLGRTDPDKGMITLLDAFINTDYNLKIIGSTSDKDYYEKLTDYIKGKKHNIEFLGHMNFDEIQIYLSKCLFTIIPSEWYDNLPNSLIESFALKKCVIATDIGSLSENIIDKKTGLLFEYKNHKSLREKVESLFQNPEIAKEYGEEAYKTIQNKFSEENHYNALISLFQNEIKK